MSPRWLLPMALWACSDPPILATADTAAPASGAEESSTAPSTDSSGDGDDADAGDSDDSDSNDSDSSEPGDSGDPSDSGDTDSRFSKSPKRGIAYDLTDPADFAALEPGVSWSVNWYFGTSADPEVAAASEVEFVPMLWGYNGESDYAALEAWFLAHPDTDDLLLLNEPNLVDQANMQPTAAVPYWRRYEQFRDDMASRHGRTIRLIGPAMTWGTLPGYGDPVVWLDAFLAAFEAEHGRPPHIDALAFHWYDYGLDEQLTRLERYGYPFWVTEMANWHSEPDWTIDTEAKQIDAMVDMVRICEEREDVERYAWFMGRWNPDPHHTSLFAAEPGVLTGLGEAYLVQPWTP